MPRPIDADALYMELVKMKDFGELTAKKAIRVVKNAPIIDAIPVSFIQELIERGKQLIEEYRGKPDYGIIVDGLIERVVNYEVLIEKWREKNGTETN